MLNSPRYRSTLQKMRINEDQVAKVVTNRIYCAAFHPSCSSLLMAAGDTIGNVGLWGLVCWLLYKGESLDLMNDIDLCPQLLLFCRTAPGAMMACCYLSPMHGV